MELYALPGGSGGRVRADAFGSDGPETAVGVTVGRS